MCGMQVHHKAKTPTRSFFLPAKFLLTLFWKVFRNPDQYFLKNIEETALSFIVTDSSQDVFTCEKSKYGFTEITTNIFNNMVQSESQIHQWLLNVPFEDIHSS